MKGKQLWHTADVLLLVARTVLAAALLVGVFSVVGSLRVGGATAPVGRDQARCVWSSSNRVLNRLHRWD